MIQHEKATRGECNTSEGHLYDIPINSVGLRDVLAVIYLIKGPEGTISNPGSAYDWADHLLYYREEG
jgi:hypothetical protein